MCAICRRRGEDGEKEDQIFNRVDDIERLRIGELVQLLHTTDKETETHKENSQDSQASE